MSTPIRTPLGDIIIQEFIPEEFIPEEFIIFDDGHPPPSTPFVEKIYICRRND
jgi:hypothetical protein